MYFRAYAPVRDNLRLGGGAAQGGKRFIPPSVLEGVFVPWAPDPREAVAQRREIQHHYYCGKANHLCNYASYEVLSSLSGCHEDFPVVAGMQRVSCAMAL